MRAFEYIEPAEPNIHVYSHRLYELLLRACTEVEANCKAILAANGYVRRERGDLNVNDFRKLNKAARLSEYEIRVLAWHGGSKIISPFAQWSSKQTALPWYQRYNWVKHNRHAEFPQASLNNALAAIAGAFVLLFSQFGCHAFRPRDSIGWYNSDGEWESHEDSIFAVKAPRTWTQEEHYGFCWNDLVSSPVKFEQFPF